MNPHIHRRAAQRGQFAEQFLTVWSVGVVGLVVSEIAPDWRHRSRGLIDLDLDIRAIAGWLRPARFVYQTEKCQTKKHPARSKSHRPFSRVPSAPTDEMSEARIHAGAHPGSGINGLVPSCPAAGDA